MRFAALIVHRVLIRFLKGTGLQLATPHGDALLPKIFVVEFANKRLTITFRLES